MKEKRISLNDRERIVLQSMISANIKRNKKAEELGIETANTTEELKALYKKIAGYEWEER